MRVSSQDRNKCGEKEVRQRNLEDGWMEGSGGVCADVLVAQERRHSYAPARFPPPAANQPAGVTCTTWINTRLHSSNTSSFGENKDQPKLGKATFTRPYRLPVSR